MLQKTYAISKRIASTGVTTSKNYHRLPTSELKTIEKIGGLVRYSPLLLIIISSHITSYNLCIENPTNVISASAKLESQSLLLAYGGLDLFFAR